MGSLMSGWSSHVLDPKVVKYQRNKSLTRGEIDAYWRSKKQGELEGGGTQSMPETPSDRHPKEHLQLGNTKDEAIKRYARSSSMPLPDRRSALYLDDAHHRHTRHDMDTRAPAVPQAPVDPPKNISCWWTASNWAFLNQPPVIADANGQSRRPYVQYSSSSSSKFCATQYTNPRMDDAGHHQISTQ